MRRRKKPGSLEKYLMYENLIVDAESQEKIAENLEEFVDGKELEVELGSGCTSFLIEHAIRNPEKKYLAIELKEELLLKAVKYVEEHEITNIRFLRNRIENLPLIFEKFSLSKLYLNFSDPWPKARHAKRRLTHPDFLNLYKKILRKNGEIEFKTDVDEMFEYSVEQFLNNGFELMEKTYDLHAEKDDVILSDYEKKFLNKGNKIKYVRVRLSEN